MSTSVLLRQRHDLVSGAGLGTNSASSANYHFSAGTPLQNLDSSELKPLAFGRGLSTDVFRKRIDKSQEISLRSFQELKRLKRVSVYGSAQTKPGDGFYEHAQTVGKALGRAGFDVVTGGGPGSMRAIAEGASGEGASTTGLAMAFIGEEHSKDVHAVMRHFDNFFSRMRAFEQEAAKTASVPGGIGTMMELTSIATKLDTKKVDDLMDDSIVLFDYKNVFKNWKTTLQNNFVKYGLMSQRAVDRFKIFDEHHIEDGIAFLKTNKNFTLAC